MCRGLWSYSRSRGVNTWRQDRWLNRHSWGEPNEDWSQPQKEEMARSGPEPHKNRNSFPWSTPYEVRTPTTWQKWDTMSLTQAIKWVNTRCYRGIRPSDNIRNKNKAYRAIMWCHTMDTKVLERHIEVCWYGLWFFRPQASGIHRWAA